MADIREALRGINEPDKSIGLLLIEFYDRMKALERDEHRGGKQATAIVMAINDIKAAALKAEDGLQNDQSAPQGDSGDHWHSMAFRHP